MAAVKNYGLIESIDELESFTERLLAGDTAIGFDIETGYHGPDRENSSLHPETAFIVGFSFTNCTDWARYVPLRHDTGPNLLPHPAMRWLYRILSTGRGVAHNAAFELRHLAREFRELLGDDPEFGAEIQATSGYFPVRACTQVEAYLVAEQPRFGLKYLINALFGHQMTELHELFPGLAKNRHKMLRFNPLDPTDTAVSDYACEDSAWCLALHERYYPQVRDRLLWQVDMGILDCVCEMEDEGVLYDWAHMRTGNEALIEFRDRYNAEIMRDLSELTGEPVTISLASVKALSAMLFEKLGYRTTIYTATTKKLPPGQRRMSTGKDAMAGLAKKHPVAAKIQCWKQQTRLSGTYLDNYEKLYGYAPDGRTHPSVGSAFVITGRFAVSDPPYQQSPKTYHFDLIEATAAHEAGEEPPPGTCFRYNFRDAVVAPPEHYILGFDLSQAELRAIAGEARETSLLEAFERGDDVHSLTAALMLHLPLQQITKDLRAIGKAQPLDAQVLTPQGWRRMGDLVVGDQVIGSDGAASKVTGVYPQGVREVFRVTTSDGAHTECCGEHLWTVRNENTHSGKWVTKQLAQLVRSGLTTGKQQFKYRLPDRPVVDFAPGPELPIDPYVLGLLLGDGGFTHSWAPMFCSADRELLDAVRVEHERRGGRWASEREQSPGFWTAYLAAGRRFDRSANHVKSALRQMGLWGHRDHEKFVPEQYLYASPADRLALLQGLLDTDGTVQASGALFRVTSFALAEAAQFLARSLGGWASLRPKPTARTPYHTRNEPRPQWMVYLRLPAGMCPFRLSRKRAKIRAVRHSTAQHITAVESVGARPVQCISVDAENGLYVTNGLITTHNTLNFALLYGMSIKGLADKLGVSIAEADELYAAYFKAFPCIAAWCERQRVKGRRDGYVMSRFGRKLPIWEYEDERPWIREKGDRACTNYPIQGAATGDYVRIVMLRARKAIRDAGLADRVRLVMNIHDALEYYVHRSVDPQRLVALLHPAVIFPVSGWPALEADWHIAKRWGSPVELQFTPDARLLVKRSGEQLESEGPTIEYDEDGEEDLVLPPIDADALRQVITAPPDTSGDPHTVVVTLREMPLDEQVLARFIALADSVPGPHQLLMRTPQGDLSLPRRTGLNASHTGQASLILGPVSITIDAAAVDAAALVADLSL